MNFHTKPGNKNLTKITFVQIDQIGYNVLKVSTDVVSVFLQTDDKCLERLLEVFELHTQVGKEPEYKKTTLNGNIFKLTKPTSGYKLRAVLWPLAVRLKTDFRPVVRFMFALDDSRLPAFHQGFQSWVPGEGWWTWQHTQCCPGLSPLSSLSPSSPPSLPEAPSQLELHGARWGQGSRCTFLSLGSGLFVSLFNGILRCQPGRCFFSLSSQSCPVWWKNLWLTCCQSSLWTKSALVLILILVWNLASLELLWSCSSVIESGVRHQSPLYSPDWGELSYQWEHLNVNEDEEIEFYSQRLQPSPALNRLAVLFYS